MNKLFKGSGIVFLLFFLLFISLSDVEAQTFTHKNVTSRVNVTNAQPEILNFTLSASPISLNAGGLKEFNCTSLVRDWNGFNDVTGVNATFYFNQNASNDPDDQNVHYTNSSCTEGGNDGLYLVNYTCAFYVSYFANNGSWNCNATAIDQRNYTGSGIKAVNISALYAVNVTDIIDYGNLSVTDYSDNITATITNFGNRAINVSVLGYGLTQGDGLGFVCAQGTNISIENQRFSSSAQPWASKTVLGITNKDLGLTLAQQTDEIVQVTAESYWQLYVPPNPFGVCTGTVRFTATTP
ncbi:MAG: hypothetical protein WC758_04715 [Candidatus Woesearchaeota archaeon]